MMFGRSMRTRLPQIHRDPEFLHKEIRGRNRQSKIRGKEYADLRRQAKESTIEVSDSVLVRKPPNFLPTTNQSPKLSPKGNKEK